MSPSSLKRHMPSSSLNLHGLFQVHTPGVNSLLIRRCSQYSIRVHCTQHPCHMLTPQLFCMCLILIWLLLKYDVLYYRVKEENWIVISCCAMCHFSQLTCNRRSLGQLAIGIYLLCTWHCTCCWGRSCPWGWILDLGVCTAKQEARFSALMLEMFWVSWLRLSAWRFCYSWQLLFPFAVIVHVFLDFLLNRHGLVWQQW